jgi:ABC-type glycerol-3-phosphate transport system permease component
MRRHRSNLAELAKHAFIWLVLGFAFFPLYLMVVISLKDNVQFAHRPFLPDAPATWKWVNWAKGFHTVADSIANSIVTSFAAVLIGLVFAILCAYVLARHRFPGRGFLYYTLMATMFLPGSAATLITTFALLKDLNLVNSLWTLVLMGAVGAQVVCVFILKQFIEEIPRELFETAQIDGAGHLRQIGNIVLPMSGSILATLAILQFVGNWNSLMLPLIILRDPQLLTVPVGLMRLEGEYVKQWGQLMAGYAIASIPLLVLFLFTMRLFVKGLVAGAVKG